MTFRRGNDGWFNDDFVNGPQPNPGGNGDDNLHRRFIKLSLEFQASFSELTSHEVVNDLIDEYLGDDADLQSRVNFLKKELAK